MPDEIPIDILNTDVDVSSGQHRPSGDVMWSYPTASNAEDDTLNELDDEKNQTDEKLRSVKAFFDPPMSMGGGDHPADNWEIGTFPGAEQNPGLSRELGLDEDVSMFGAPEDGMDLPPVNNSCKDEELGEDMINELNKLELTLKGLGKLKKASEVCDFKKNAGTGIALVDLLGQKAMEYLYQKPEVKSAIDVQLDKLNEIEQRMLKAGVTDDEMRGIRRGTLKPRSIVDAMKVRGREVSLAEQESIESLANHYLNEYINLRAFAEGVQSSSPEESGPKAAHSREGSIKRPGDPYTYDPHEEGYVVVSAPEKEGYPKGQEPGVGNIIRPGTEGYDEIRAYDPAVAVGESDPSEISDPSQIEFIDSVNEMEGETLPNEEAVDEGIADSEEPEESGYAGEAVIITSEKQREISDYLNKTYGEEDGRVRYTALIRALKAGNFTLNESETQPEGRRIGLASFQNDLPANLRYDGVYFDEGREAWIAGGLSKREIRALQLDRGSTQRKEVRREKRQDKRDVRRERVDTRQKERVNRRDKARKASRKSLLRELHKVSREK
jgi:hypothetical protein